MKYKILSTKFKMLIVFSVFLLVGCVSAQVDTASTFIYNLPSSARIDTNYILIAESPTTTYKINWKQLQRSLNYKKLVQTTLGIGADVISITKTNAGKDTTKGLKLSDFYKNFMKDSVKTDIGIAETSINSKIDSLDGALSAEIALKASIARANDISDSLDTAYSEILLKASTSRVNSTRDSLYSAIALKASVIQHNALSDSVDTAFSELLLKASTQRVNATRDSLYSAISLKASVSQYNQLSDSMSTAYSQILLEAGTRSTADSSLTASISLKVSANDVYSLLEILPDSVKIQSDNIILDGAVVASSLISQTVEALSFATYSGYPAQAEMTQSGFSIYGSVGDDAGQGYIIGRNSSRMTITGANVGNRGLDVLGTITENGSVNINAGNIASYALTSLPTHGNESHSATYLVTETDPTIYAWAKAATKPSYTYSEVGASASGHNHSGIYLESETDPTIYAWAKAASKPTYTYSEVGAQVAGSYVTTETDPTIYSWAKAATKPTYTYSEVGAQVAGSYLTAVPNGFYLGTTDESHTVGSINLSDGSMFNTITGTKISDWDALVSFPGFGTSGTTAAYGNHNHSGVYHPYVSGGKTITYSIEDGNLDVWTSQYSNGVLISLKKNGVEQ